ncbi:MAG: PilZ domain-containing protein [Treponemataceae bacterium]
MLYFLQSGISPLEARQNPYIYFGFIIAGMGILFFFALNKMFQKKIFDLIRRSASRKEINTVSDYFNLDKDEKLFLTRLCRQFRIKNLAFCFKNDTAVDSLFKKIYHVMSESKNHDKDIDDLFLLRQKIEQFRRKTSLITSSQNIPRNQEITLITSRKEQYIAMLLENSPQGLIITTPRDSLKNEVVFKPLTKLGIFLRSKNFVDYIFTSRVLRYSSMQNINTLVLMHSNNFVTLRSREFRRKNISENIQLTYAVPQIDSAAASKESSSVQRNFISYKFSGGSFSASMIDVSVGGCCIKSSKMVSPDQHLKIEIEHKKFQDEEIIGQVLRSQIKENEIILHIQFKKITKKARNVIFSLVYAYD